MDNSKSAMENTKVSKHTLALQNNCMGGREKQLINNAQ